jgi:DNA-binding MarR family transcriptional regulator
VARLTLCSDAWNRKEITLRKVNISELSRAMIEIGWHLGPKGLNGECCESLSMPEFIALDKIAHTHDCPVQDIGQVLGFTKSGATRIVNRLEKKRCIRRVKSVTDARFCCVVITKYGKDILKAADENYSEKFQNMLNRMPKQYAPQMTNIFKAVANAIKD